MKEFITAALEQEDSEEIVFMHDGREVRFFVPSTGQQAIMLAMGRRGDMDPRAAGTFISLFFEMADADTQRYFESRLMDREDTGFDLDTDGGMFDLFDYISSQWSPKAPKQPADYQKSQSTTGTASKAPTRVRASSSSRTRSRVSST